MLLCRLLSAADCNGGALSLTSGSVCLHTDHSDMTPEYIQPSRFEATQLITFKGNSVSMKWQSAVAGQQRVTTVS